MFEEKARDTLDRVARGTAGASRGEVVRSMGCILVPSDGMALYFFAAPSEEAVRRISTLAEVPFDRIIESVHIGVIGPPI